MYKTTVWRIANKACVLLAIVFLFACNHSTEHPHKLVMADSAFMQGDFQLGKALLEASKNKVESNEIESVKEYIQLLQLEQLFLLGKGADISLAIDLHQDIKKDILPNHRGNDSKTVAD